MKNLEVANILNEIADLQEIADIKYKPIAYRRAALSLEDLSEDLEVLAKEDKLEEIPGVGKGISRDIKEILKTGTTKELKKLHKTIPINYKELSSIEGLGPKKIKILYNKLKIKNIKDLEKAAKKDKIAKLEGFGIKSQRSILHNLTFAKTTQDKYLLGSSLPIALRLENALSKHSDVQKVKVAGSIRRMKEVIKDIDILVAGKNEDKIMDYFTKLKDVDRIMLKGKTKTSVKLNNNMQVDIRVVDLKSWGAALNYFTGSKSHNVALRKLAIKKGLKLNEYGLFKKNKYVAGKSEEELYKKLNLKYIPPELREMHGEIMASKNNKLPKLIELKDVKGDLQMHSTYSDGSNTIEEMAKEAKRLNYEYICITDHVGNLRIANALDAKRLNKQRKEIDKLNKKIHGIHIFHGCEVNIDKNAKLDMHNSILKDMDIVLASIHSALRQDKKVQTKRIIDTMENEHVDIIAHPTGRVLLYREAFDFDFDKVLDKAKETNTILEVNSHPSRLDLKDTHARKVIESKNKLSFGTDAHSKEELHYMLYGVSTARRGWAEKKDVINTLNLKEIKKLFNIN